MELKIKIFNYLAQKLEYHLLKKKKTFASAPLSILMAARSI